MSEGMAYVCQGCRGIEEDPSVMSSRGIVTEKFYCNKCIERVDEYLDARDRLHTELAERWAEGRVALASDFQSGGFRNLPDGG